MMSLFQMISMMSENATADKDSLEKLKKEVETVVKDVNESAKILHSYKKSAEMDAMAVKSALDEAKQAQTDAKNAEGLS